MTAKSDAQHQRPPIGQPRLGSFHPLTQHRQIVREPTIIEGAQLYLHRICSPDNPTRQAKKGLQALPGGLGIRSGKVLLTDPQHQIHQRQLERSHHLILGLVELVHGELGVRQVLQRAQHLTLLSAMAFARAELGGARIAGLPLALLIRGNLGIGGMLLPPDRQPHLIAVHPLSEQFLLVVGLRLGLLATAS